jgi:T5orf172 domain
MWFVISYLKSWFSSSPRKSGYSERGEEQKQYLYAIRYADSSGQLYKVGKTINLDQRLRTYRTLLPGGKWFYTVHVNDMHMSEKILHAMLKMKGRHVEREIFRSDGSSVKNLMELVQQIDRIVSKRSSVRTIEAAVAALKRV